MSVKIRLYKGGPDLEADARYEHPDGTVERVRRRFKNGTSEGEARRWAEQVLVKIANGDWKRRRAALREKKHVMTLGAFASIFIEDYCPGHGNKESTVHNKKGHLERHILPLMECKPLDMITSRDVESLLDRIKHMAIESKNNHLATLDTLLKAAVERKEIDRLPCEIKMLQGRAEKYPQFYSFDEYDQLIAGAETLGLSELAAIGFGGDEGMRCGEVAAVKWCDIDLTSSIPSVTVRRTAWREKDLLPKRNKERKVPLTAMMKATLTKLVERQRRDLVHSADRLTVVALADVRLRDRYIFPGTKHDRVAPTTVRDWLKRTQDVAGLPVSGKFHMLRHTFCSHLAARGIPIVDIKELAGHRSIITTQKYIHSMTGAKERGIAALDEARAAKKKAAKRTGHKASTRTSKE